MDTAMTVYQSWGTDKNPITPTSALTPWSSTIAAMPASSLVARPRPQLIPSPMFILGIRSSITFLAFPAWPPVQGTPSFFTMALMAEQSSTQPPMIAGNKTVQSSPARLALAPPDQQVFCSSSTKFITSTRDRVAKRMEEDSISTLPLPTRRCSTTTPTTTMVRVLYCVVEEELDTYLTGTILSDITSAKMTAETTLEVTIPLAEFR